MLARIQQAITATLLAGAVAWLVYFWERSALIALGGFAVVVLGYSAFLAMEFLALRFVGRSDPVPRPSWKELAGAWWGETLTAPQVFCWRQPFRSSVIPDQLHPASVERGKRGVVFVHGFFCNRGFWSPWLEQLKGTGHAFTAVNLEPPFASIDDYVQVIEDAVVAVTDVTGMPPLLVCHSMGGLAARAWLKAKRGEERICHVVTIGTPHRGTWLARFSYLANGRQMRLSGQWHRDLDRDMPAHRHSLFTCWYSNCDNIVFPSSTATLPDADNRLVRGVAHVQLALVPRVIQSSLDFLKIESVAK